MLITIAHVTCLVVLASVLLAITQFIDSYHKDEMKGFKDEAQKKQVPKPKKDSESLKSLRNKQDNLIATNVTRFTNHVYGIYGLLTLLAIFALSLPIIKFFKLPYVVNFAFIFLSSVLVVLYIKTGKSAFACGKDRQSMHKNTEEFIIEFETKQQTWKDAQNNPDERFDNCD